MSEDSLRHLEDTIKWNSIYMWGWIPRGEEREKEAERFSENLGKETDIQI